MLPVSVAEVVEAFERDRAALRRLAELLVSEPDVRLAIVNAVLRDVATKQDIEKLREELRNEFKNEMERLREDLRTEFRSEIERLRNELRIEIRSEIGRMEGRLNQLEGRVSRL